MLDTTLASKSVLAFAVMGLTSTNNDWTVRNSTYNHKKKTYALVKAHKRTEVYATVLATVKKNVDVFQLVSCDNHLRVDIKRRSEAQEQHSIPAAQQQ